MAERRMTEVDRQDLVEMIDCTYGEWVPSSDPTIYAERLAAALADAGWRVVRPIQKSTSRGRARGRTRIQEP